MHVWSTAGTFPTSTDMATWLCYSEWMAAARILDLAWRGIEGHTDVVPSVRCTNYPNNSHIYAILAYLCNTLPYNIAYLH